MTSATTDLRTRIPLGTSLWAGLAAELESRLLAGEFEGRMPTEAELVATYKVSRSTVREALRRLRARGLIEARQGAGTFVAQRGFDEPLLGRAGLARLIDESGAHERSEVLVARSVRLPAEPATALSVPSGLGAIEIERLRFGGNDPVALDHSFFVLDERFHRAFLDSSLESGSIYDLLSSIAGIVVMGGRELVRAVVGGARERRLLRVGTGTGLLALERLTYAKDGAFEWRRSLLDGARWTFDTTWGQLPS